MEVSEEVSSKVRGWLRASPASSRRKPPPTYVPILPRPERLGLGAEPREESADAARSLAVAVRMERKITGRRRRKQANTDSTVDATDSKCVWMTESHSQDVRETSDEECSRTIAVGTSGMKMGGTRSQELLLGGCKGLQRRKRKRRKRQKQEVAVSKATVSKATVSKATVSKATVSRTTVSGTTKSDSNQLSSVKLTGEDKRLEDSKQHSPSTATNFDSPPEENRVLLEVLSAEATRSQLDSKEPSKRPKSALHGTKKHGRTSLKKTRQRARPSDTEESPIAAQAVKRTQHEKSIPSELDMLKRFPQSNTEATSSRDLSTSTHLSRNIKRRLKNAKNFNKLETSVFAYPNPALDKAGWQQAMRDVDMESGVLSQRTVVHGNRAKRQLQRKAFLRQKRKLMRKRSHT